MEKDRKDHKDCLLYYHLPLCILSKDVKTKLNKKKFEFGNIKYNKCYFQSGISI